MLLTRNRALRHARKEKFDEFYTQITDIEKELGHYEKHFKGKTVYCNCDDPRVSNFFRYFSLNFERLGLKRLITTCYKSDDANLFSRHNKTQAVWLEFNGDLNGNGIPDPEEIGVFPLKGDGDFRSDECIEILKQADIVVTNPPFSLFREYVAQLIKFDKKFLIIGNKNAVTYKEIFPLFKENKVWFGPSITSGDREFQIPRNVETRSKSLRVDASGKKFIRVPGVHWFTNLDHSKRHEELVLYKSFSPEDYPTYDNVDAIEVGLTVEIPKEYPGLMGVPVTFLDKYNPDQFEILGLDDIGNGWRGRGPDLKGKPKYRRIIIRNKRLAS